MNTELFLESVRSLGLELSQEQVDLFLLFETNLYETNKVMNMTRVPEEECWLRHFLDSLLIHDLIPKHAFVLDIGTGPGFPGWPLACARPDIKVTAIDSNGKMASFLRTMPLPNLTVVKDRAEDWKVNERFDFVTGRAVAPLSTQLELSARPCRIKKRIVPMRTPTDKALLQTIDLEPLGLKYVDSVEKPLTGTDVVRLFPIFEKVAKTKIGFPRRWADIKAFPL